MALEDDMAVLARVSLFGTFSEEQLRLIAFGAEPYELSAGRLLCRSGETADGGFVLVSGRLARIDTNTEAVERSFAEAGTLVGELSLTTRCAWQSTIIAETACRLLRLPRPLFLRILSEYPKTASEIRQRLSADLATKVRLMEVVAKKLG
jgi:CRP-like cAMP-binding protein